MAPTPDLAAPPVSVIVPTRDAWPALEPVLEALLPQIVTAGAELVVVDGTKDGRALDELPAGTDDAAPRVRAVHAPGADILELRAVGLAHATGHVVAITEDHCRTEPNYVEGIRRAHERHPEVLVAGAVINGATDRLIDRVNFLVVHARNLPPHDSIPDHGWIPTPTNASYKRDGITPTQPRRGWIETVLNPSLLAQHQVVIDDRIVVRHIQSLGWLGTARNHFHAGRAMGGLARPAIGRRAAQLRWGLRSTPMIPPRLVRPVWEHERRRSRTGGLVVVPIAAVLSVVGAVGFAWGVIAGPGRSPELVD